MRVKFEQQNLFGRCEFCGKVFIGFDEFDIHGILERHRQLKHYDKLLEHTFYKRRTGKFEKHLFLKTEFLVKNGSFRRKSNSLSKKRNLSHNSKFAAKFEILVQTRNFRQNPKLSPKIKILVKIRNFRQNIFVPYFCQTFVKPETFLKIRNFRRNPKF